MIKVDVVSLKPMMQNLSRQSFVRKSMPKSLSMDVFAPINKAVSGKLGCEGLCDGMCDPCPATP